MSVRRFRFSNIFWYGLLVLPAIPFLLHFTQFFYLPEAEFSDLTISHLPNLEYLGRAIREHVVIPLWSPAILSGFPYFANPLSGLWYPPGWLGAVWPAPWVFNLLAVMHLAWGAVGLQRLLRLEGLGNAAAWFGAAAFALLPKLASHYGAGHITLLYAVSWTPWLLAASHSSSISKRRYLPAVFLAVIFYADPRWAAYAGIGWLAYAFLHGRENGASVRGIQFPALQSFLKTAVVQVLIAFGLSAPLLVPLLEYSRLSTRSLMQPADILAFSFPPARLLGLLFPDFGGTAEWTIYPGALVLILGLSIILFPIKRFETHRIDHLTFWKWILAGSLLFSFGESVPFSSLLASLPGANLLRVPPRALFLFGMALSALAAYGFGALLSGEGAGGILPKPAISQFRRRSNLVLAALVIFWLLFAGAVAVFSREAPPNFIWGLVFGSLGAFILALKKFISNKPGVLLLLAFAITGIDLVGVNLLTLQPRTEKEIYSQGKSVAGWLADQDGPPFRVYSPSYSLPQHTAARFGLELAYGVDPLQLQTYQESMAAATGIPSEGYSVTLPPFSDGDIRLANAEFVPDAAQLGDWNVRFVASAFEMEVAGLELRTVIDSIYVYENLLNRPRVETHWMLMDEIPRTAKISSREPNRTVVDVGLEGAAREPGRLRFNQPAYPYWFVLVDGEWAQPIWNDTNLRDIPIPAGAREMELRFLPLSLLLGLTIFFLTGVWTWFRIKRLKSPEK